MLLKDFEILATLHPMTLYLVPSSALCLVIMTLGTVTFTPSVPYEP
jgi:hypothetical protein